MENKRVKQKQKNEITIKANKKGRHVMPLMNILKGIVVPVYKIFRPFRYYGNKKVKDGACLYICNHYGIFDVIYPAMTTSEGLHFVAKKQVFDMPVIGFLARKVKAISVNRDHKDVRGLLDCFKCLKNNEKICIFPEGTRNKVGAELLPFQPGAAMMAIRCKKPIVPIMIYKKPRAFRMTHVLVGDAFELSEYYDKKLTDEDLKEADNKLYNIMLGLRKSHREFLEQIKLKKKSKA